MLDATPMQSIHVFYQKQIFVCSMAIYLFSTIIPIHQIFNLHILPSQKCSRKSSPSKRLVITKTADGITGMYVMFLPIECYPLPWRYGRCGHIVRVEWNMMRTECWAFSCAK